MLTKNAMVKEAKFIKPQKELEEAFEVAKKKKDFTDMALALIQLGLHFEAAGDLDRAIKRYEDAEAYAGYEDLPNHEVMKIAKKLADDCREKKVEQQK
jgi:tetratricopeptide (TPR) repeat protein